MMEIYLLQIDYTALPFAVVVLIILFLIQVTILRWIFKVDEQVTNQRATIWLLINLCIKNGVDPEAIDEIKKAFKIK